MSCVYKNITDQTQLIAVMNEMRTDVSHVQVGPGARIEVSSPVLDMYMPHVLARLNEQGVDITHILLRGKEDSKVRAAAPVVEEVVPVVEVPVVEEVAPEVEVPVVEAAPAKKSKK